MMALVQDSMDEDLVAVGKIVKVQGKKGEVRIMPLTDFPERFKDLKSVILVFSKQEKRIYTLQYVRFYKNRIIAKLQEINSIDEASELIDVEVAIPSDELIPLGKDEYYQFELIGMDVYTEKGRYLGKIDSIFPTGSNDVYVVKRDDKEYLIPAIKEVVSFLDTLKKKMIITPIKDLLEEDDL
ncbi:MAG: ribosome maturation factor RimM [bacterium]